MTTLAAYDLIRDYLTANWVTTPMSWENEAFTTPADGSGNDLPFVAVQLTQDEWDQASIGAGDRTENRWQETGELYLNVIVPLNTGTETARIYATTLANLFRGEQLEDIEFRDISIGLGVIAEDRGPWWLLPVRISWLKG